MTLNFRQLVFAAMALASFACSHARAEQPPAAATAEPEMTLDLFLDRLMMAESGGRLMARNPNSTAVGPFQFIASTWLQIARRNFAEETSALQPHQVLELRTDADFARRAAKLYSQENAAYLVSQGAKATFPNLRLAFLVGPGGAVRVLTAKSDTPVASVLGPTVIDANPFMRRMTVEDLIARAAKDIETDATTVAGIVPDAAAIADAGKPAPKAKPKIAVACDLSRPSCRRWLALATRKLSRSKRASRE